VYIEWHTNNIHFYCFVFYCFVFYMGEAIYFVSNLGGGGYKLHVKLIGKGAYACIWVSFSLLGPHFGQFTKSKVIFHPLIVLETNWKFNTMYKRPWSFIHRKPHISIWHSFYLGSVLVTVTRTARNYHPKNYSVFPLQPY